MRIITYIRCLEFHPYAYSKRLSQNISFRHLNLYLFNRTWISWAIRAVSEVFSPSYLLKISIEWTVPEMEHRTVTNDENDILDQPFSPFLQFETQEDQHNTEKRMEEKNLLVWGRDFLLESKWSHQRDLDDFFIRIYQYHQRHGFICIVLSELFGLV